MTGPPTGNGRGFDDPGLPSPSETALLIDQYELAMSESYLRRGMDEPAVFELFTRRLPPHREWLLAAGIGPALRLVSELSFGDRELEFLRSVGFGEPFLDYLAGFRFCGDIDAMPEGTVVFPNEPLLRVTGSRIEAQLLETILLNQINFQTAIATKAARIVLAAGGGHPDPGGAVVDFSPRRDHGVDAALKAARAAAVAGAGGTSNVAAAMRYGLTPMGTMAHSYVMSFDSEHAAFRAFMEDTPENALLLVDTYDAVEGVRQAISASRETGVPLKGVRIDSGDLMELSCQARRLLDDAGMKDATILASGDLEERQIIGLVAEGAPIDAWGVGTDLGTSRDSPAVSGVYKLVADRPAGRSDWRPVVKRSPAKTTVPHPKQVFRRTREGTMAGDVIAAAEETLEGHALLVPAMRQGTIVHTEPLEDIRARAHAELVALPQDLKLPPEDAHPDAYPVTYSRFLRDLDPEATAKNATVAVEDGP